MALIWKDYFVSIPVSGSSALYRVRLTNSTGTIIHTGRIVPAPGATSVSVRLNAIAAPYVKQAELNATYFDGSGAFVASFASVPSLAPTFYVESSADGGSTWTPRGTVQFIADWSYTTARESSFRKSDPIIPVLDARQVLIYTTLATTLAAVAGTTTIYSGAVTNGNLLVNLFDAAPSGDTLIVTDGGGAFTYAIDRSGCKTHVLHYINAYGGWDSLLITGKVLKNDGYKRLTTGVSYNNANERGLQNYANGIERRWELHTDWLTDAQADKMHHLLGSTNVWLTDLRTMEAVPVVLTNGECAYKQFRTNGHKMAAYTIEAQQAATLERR